MDCDTVSLNKKGPSGAGTEGTSSKGPSSAASASSPCFNAKTLWRRRRCCRRRNVSSQVMWRSSASTLTLLSARTRSWPSTVSRSRRNTVACDAADSVSDWDDAAAADAEGPSDAITWQKAEEVLVRGCLS